MADRLTEYAKAIIQRNRFMSLSTVSDAGDPWNSPLYFSFDNAGNVYWMSTSQAQHSQNVEANGKGFIAIFDSTPNWGIGQALYMKANVSVVTDLAELLSATATWLGRAGIEADSVAAVDEGKRFIYKAVPTDAWINDGIFNDEGELVGDTRATLPLDTLKNLVNW